MTNEEWLRTASYDDLVKFLDSIDPEMPWFDEFTKKICDLKCGREECIAPNCPFGDPIEWWLKQEHKPN